MTASEQLRQMVEKAMPGTWTARTPDTGPGYWEVHSEDNQICELDFRTILDFDKRDEMTARLMAMAPQLALLCADMGEALNAIQTHTRFSEMADGEKRIMQVAGVLARLDGLFSEEAVT